MKVMRCEIYRYYLDNKNAYMTHYIPINVLPNKFDSIELYDRDKEETSYMEVYNTILGFEEDEVYMNIYVI